MKPTPKKKQPVKARKVLTIAYLGESRKSYIYHLPASRQAFSDMAEQMARGMYANERRYESKKMTWETTWQAVRDAYLKDAHAALAAIGITSPTNDAGREGRAT